MARTMPRTNIGEKSNNLYTIGAIGLALLAAILAFASLRTLNGGDGGGSLGGDIDVVVASQRIGTSQLISEDMLEIKKVSESSQVEGALTSFEGIVGLVARHPIEKGAQFTAETVGQAGEEGSELARVIPDGRRGVTVEVTEEKIFGGLLAPGDHVDVIAIIHRSIDGEEIPMAIALAQNIEVMAVADTSLEPIVRRDKDGNPIVTEESTGSLGALPDDLDAQPEARSVTLAVLPEEALRIALSQEEGAVWLSLRGSGDDGTPPIEPQTLTN